MPATRPGLGAPCPVLWMPSTEPGGRVVRPFPSAQTPSLGVYCAKGGLFESVMPAEARTGSWVALLADDDLDGLGVESEGSQQRIGELEL